MTAPDHDLLAEVKRMLHAHAEVESLPHGAPLSQERLAGEMFDRCPELLAALVARVVELEALEARVRAASPIIADEIYGRMQETLAHDPAPALEQRAIGATAERKRIVALLRERNVTVLDAIADEIEAGGEGGG